MKQLVYAVLALFMLGLGQSAFGQSKAPIAPNFQSPFPAKQPASTYSGFRPPAAAQPSLRLDRKGERIAIEVPRQLELSRGAFLRAVAQETKMADGVDFELIRTEQDELGFSHHRYQQTVGGFAVVGSQLILHERNGRIEYANGRVIQDLTRNSVPSISAQAAITNALNHIGATTYTWEVPAMVKYKQDQADDPTLTLAPVATLVWISGDGQLDRSVLAYKVGVSAVDPVGEYDVYVNASTGAIEASHSKIAHTDAVGTGATLYYGTQTFTADDVGGSFRLSETARPIHTIDMQNADLSGVPNAVEFTDDDNNWTDQTPTVASISVTALSQSWWYNSIADQTPDIYLVVKDGSSTIVGTTNYFSNQHPTLTFTIGLAMLNPTYTVEIYDYDPVGADDYGGSFTLTLTPGSHSFSTNGNSGTYTVEQGASPAIDVHWGMEQTYDFFLNEFGRDSYDNAGSQITNHVHTDVALNNAFWNPAVPGMFYGDGDGNTMNEVVGLDVVGHEFSHAVISATANLVYQGESGALNESFADILGIGVERYAFPGSWDYFMGEDIMVNSPFLRSLSNPNDADNPDTYGGQFWVDPTNLAYDYGGVHINSGVQNYWFYLLSNGGSGTNDNGDNFSVTAIGMDDALQIAYRNLTVYLSMNSDFDEAVQGSIQSAEDLFGNGSAQYWAVIEAWYAVGLLSFDAGYCDGTTVLTDATGTFSDGSGSADYAHDSDCMWRIAPSGATSITLNFSAFATEAGYDSVIVYDGPDTLSPVLTSWWGNTLPPAITSTGGAMLVRFQSDDIVADAGWDASYTSTGTAYCEGGNLLTESSGSFDDGSGGNDYGNNAVCWWQIAPPGATSITLSFSSFNTELTYDGIVVYDGLTTDDPVLGSYSGSAVPPALTSSGGEMLVLFLSDYVVSESGWAASYTSTGSPHCSGTTTLTADYDVLDDGSGTADYYNNSNCSWLIQPTGATAVTLTFTEFALEETSSDGLTFFDMVEVFDGTNSGAPLLGRFAGAEIPETVTSTGGSIYLRFTSDITVTEGGWEAYYTSISNPGCSGATTLTTATGSFSDGSGGNNYANASDCQWLIQPAGATSITLNFTAFDTEQDYDGVIVYDGADTSATPLGVYTGSSLPPTVTSTGGSMLVWFLSDELVRGGGWDASYTSTISTGIGQGIELASVQVFPNPNTGVFNVQLAGSQLDLRSITIYDPVGRVVTTRQAPKNADLVAFDLTEQPAGVYFVKVTDGTNTVTRRIEKLD